jgi:hypothetical protein
MDDHHFGYKNRQKKKQGRKKKIKIRMVPVLENRLQYFWVF